VIEAGNFQDALAEVMRRTADICSRHPAALFLPAFYRSSPPSIYLSPRRVQVFTRGSSVLNEKVRPVDLPARGYQCRRNARYRLVYEFRPGKAYELELAGYLWWKELGDKGLEEEAAAFLASLGVYDVVPVLSLEMLVDGDTVPLRVKRLDPGIGLPSYAHPGDAGLDLRSAEDLELLPGQRALVSTGFSMALPEGYAAFVQPRSGLAARHGISIVNTPGLIDCHYRGEVKVILINLGDKPFRVRRGDRIAQMVIQRVENVEVVEVEELESTERGEGGFGSTGL
jgi:dUTP pyrophosphatase